MQLIRKILSSIDDPALTVGRIDNAQTGDMFSQIGDVNNERKFSKRAEVNRTAIFSEMWDGDKYVDIFGKGNVKSSIKAASMFYPMMLDGEPHYKHLIENHLLNPDEFASPYGITTTSRDDPSYAPDSYWRGNVWHNVNYFVVLGLKKVYSEHEFSPAREAINYIMISSYILLYQKGSPEYFNPETGEGYGVRSFGWNGIVRKMFSWHEPGLGHFAEVLATVSSFKMRTVNIKDLTPHLEFEFSALTYLS